MSRYLIVKMSSLGDILHTLAAVSDAKHFRPDLKFDWLVEKGFAEIPTWHPAVDKIIPIELRNWRKAPWQAIRSGVFGDFKRDLRARTYEGVLDVQGLFKSSLISVLAKGQRIGLDRDSAREGLATLLYHKRLSIPTGQHAVTRLREFFAKVFDYPMPSTAPDFGIDVKQLKPVDVGERYLVFLHGTSWATKHWPVEHWQHLIQLAREQHFEVYLPWGNHEEYERAEHLASLWLNKGVRVLPKLSLSQITYVLAKAKAVVAVDTGLGHIAAALGRPTLSLYGATDAKLTGACGIQSQHMVSPLSCAPCFKRFCLLEGADSSQPPCFQSLKPINVWEALDKMILNDSNT